MAGGLMQLVSQGQQNILLNGNPSKTFFKSVFAQYTNFALQKFRVDFEGSKTLRLTEPSTYTFKIPRYADLLMDCYLSVVLPNIWSPILPPQTQDSDTWVPYEFKWIQNLGAKMISKISITCGNYTLQEYSGDYLLSAVQRDFNTDKKTLFDNMTGNVAEINDPANAGLHVNAYPNAYYTDILAGPEPSIRGRTLYIPLNNWFGLKSQMAFPLTSLQYNELHINITLRPINQLFQIRDVFDSVNNYPYVSPNFNLWYMQFYRFLQPPPDVNVAIDSYSDLRTLWNADVHLNCTYCFLSNDEERQFALQEQKYLIKQVYEKHFYNVTGPNKVNLESIGMVSNWMFYFQRSDANLRNEWSNYTNWPYNYVPNDIILSPLVGPPGQQELFITPVYTPENDKYILISLGILLDGSYRENIQPSGVFNYVEKYTRTSGNAPEGLYCYNFAINSNNMDLQPSGAINMSRFNLIEYEFTTIIPPLDPLAQSLVVCDPSTGEIIGINKPTWRIYDYNFNLTVFEERINHIIFVGGNCGLAYAT
jgi:hypothetical protein